MSPDGHCGFANNGQVITCTGSGFGNCCSRYVRSSLAARQRDFLAHIRDHRAGADRRRDTAPQQISARAHSELALVSSAMSLPSSTGDVMMPDRRANQKSLPSDCDWSSAVGDSLLGCPIDDLVMHNVIAQGKHASSLPTSFRIRATF